MFKKCSNFKTISIKNLASFKDGERNIGSSAFHYVQCENIIFDSSVNYIGGIENADTNGVRIKAAKNLYYLGTLKNWCEIGHGGLDVENFYINGQEMKGDLTLPEGITSIGAYAFYGCTGLTSVTIPDSITSIGGRAFYNCKWLTSIKYRGTEAGWADISKGDAWDLYYYGPNFHGHGDIHYQINYTITYNYTGE